MTLLAGLLLLAAAPTPAPAPTVRVDTLFDLEKHDTDFSDVKPRPGVFLSRHGASGTAIYVDPFGQIENIA